MRKILTIVLITAMSLMMSLQAVSAESRPLSKEVHISEWIGALEDAADYYNGENSRHIVFKYHKGWDEDRGFTNCAGYVSHAMRDMGWLSGDHKIWLSSRINGSGASEIKNNDDFEILYPNTETRSTDLHPGDIVGYHWGSTKKNQVHTMVYIGDGKWYSYGPGTKNWHTGPIPKKSYDTKKVKVIIRYRNLRIADDYSLRVSVKNGTVSMDDKETNSISALIDHGEVAELKFKADEGYVLKTAKMDGSDIDIEDPVTIPMLSNHRISVEYEYKYDKYLPEDMKGGEPNDDILKNLKDITNDPVVKTDLKNIYAVIFKADKKDPKPVKVKTKDGKIDFEETIKDDGKYTIIVCGEKDGKKYLAGKTFVYDRTFPKAQIEGVEEGKEYSDSVEIHASAEDENLFNYAVYVNDEKMETNDLCIEGDGEYKITLKAFDKAGNAFEDEKTFTIKRPLTSYDTAAQVKVKRNEPADNSKKGEVESVTIKAGVPGETTLHVYKSGKLIHEETSLRQITYQDFSQDGTYGLYAYVTDAFGNEKIIRPVIIDKGEN